MLDPGGAPNGQRHLAVGDVTGDGWPDLFLASHKGGNRLLVNDGRGRFREAASLTPMFAWPGSGGDNMVCGVTMAELAATRRVPDLIRNFGVDRFREFRQVDEMGAPAASH